MSDRAAILALEDGRIFRGRSFGAPMEKTGEVVFNTSMTGYQEILTDPSYCGQLVAMTYPEIGNVGVNPEDVESRQPFVEGFIVKEYWNLPSNWRARRSLHEYLEQHGIPAIEGIDTRALVRRIRDSGTQNAVLSTRDADTDELVAVADAQEEEIAAVLKLFEPDAVPGGVEERDGLGQRRQQGRPGILERCHLLTTNGKGHFHSSLHRYWLHRARPRGHHV